MCCPTSVCNSNMGVEDLCKIRLGLLDQLLKLHDLADFLESENLVSLVAVDRKTSGVIATVF